MKIYIHTVDLTEAYLETQCQNDASYELAREEELIEYLDNEWEKMIEMIREDCPGVCEFLNKPVWREQEHDWDRINAIFQEENEIEPICNIAAYAYHGTDHEDILPFPKKGDIIGLTGEDLHFYATFGCEFVESARTNSAAHTYLCDLTTDQLQDSMADRNSKCLDGEGAEILEGAIIRHLETCGISFADDDSPEIVILDGGE